MTVTLKSQDEKTFVVPREVAEKSVLLKNMLEDVGESDAPIPLPNVTGKVLEKVIAYCTHHKDDPVPSVEDEKDVFDAYRRKIEDVEEWDADFIKVEKEELFEIILAANYLDIKPLLDLGCRTVADMLKGKSPEQIRDMFNIENDFTPEEEEQVPFF
jgi:S-phase kinase-associated protein 1